MKGNIMKDKRQRSIGQRGYPDSEIGAEKRPTCPQFPPKTVNQLDDSDIGRQIRFNYRSDKEKGGWGPLGTATATLLGFERGIDHMTLTLESIGTVRKVTPWDVPLNTIIVSYPM